MASYFARDPHSGGLILTVPSSNLPPLAMPDAALQKLRVDSILRNKAPFNPEYTASILGVRLTQKRAYDILMHLLRMRSSLKAILLYLEDAAKSDFEDEAELCIGILNDGPEHQIVSAQDVVFARHASLVDNMASLIGSKSSLWPSEWAAEFPIMVEDVLELRLRKLFDGYGTPRRGGVHPDLTSPDTRNGYMALSGDVEMGVGVLVRALGTEEIWKSTTECGPPMPFVVEDMLRGIIPSDASLVTVVAGFSMRRGEALSILKHLCWIRYSLGMIIMLIHDDASEMHSVSLPYPYITNGLYGRLRSDVASFHLATEDRIAIRHIAVFTNLELLLERRASDEGPSLALWPETEAWKREFPYLERSAYLANFRMARNAFAHEYASPKANDLLYANLFSDQMKGHCVKLMQDVSRAMDYFEAALRTQRLLGTVS